MPPSAPQTRHAAFKQQNAVHGLPLQLSAEEVTLALEKGWGELAPALDTAALAVALGGGSRKRTRQPAHHYYEEDEEGYGSDADMADAGAQQAQQAQQQQAAEPTWRPALASGAAFQIPITLAEAAAANEGRSGPEEAAAGGAAPAADGATAAGAAGGAEAAAAAAAPGSKAAAAAPVQWAFPATREERHRYWVFRDLHAKG